MKLLAPAILLTLASQAATAPMVANAVAQRDVDPKPLTTILFPEPRSQAAKTVLKDQSLIDARDILTR